MEVLSSLQRPSWNWKADAIRALPAGGLSSHADTDKQGGVNLDGSTPALPPPPFFSTSSLLPLLSEASVGLGDVEETAG